MSNPTLKKQKRVFVLLCGAVICVIFLISYLILKDKQHSISPEPIRLDLPTDKINPQEVLLTRIEAQNQLFEQKFKYLESIITSSKQQEERTGIEKEQLKQELALLRQELTQVKTHKTAPTLVPEPLTPLEIVSPSQLVEITMQEPSAPIHNVSSAIPAGTSVKAILLSSVDANCGVLTVNNPIPVKLRILDDAHLPKQIDVKLKGGLIIGSAYGNLSSERIYIRAERLTQVNPDGDFVETEIAGYVSGDDGKYGLRGKVVDKSGKIITHAALSGLLAESSQILQSAVGSYKIGNYLNANQSVNNPVLPGTLSGASNAFDMLADYYIRRAEQVEPVIQVNSGRIVDITFTHGAEVGALHTKEEIHSLRERTRAQDSQEIFP